MNPPLLGLLLLVAGATDTGEAIAEQPALTFQFTGCPDDVAHDIEELVRADVSWAPGDPPAALAVRCQDQGIALTLTADDAPIAARTLDLRTTPPEARARTAALVAAELILMARQPVPPVLPMRRGPASSGPAPPERDEPIAIAPARVETAVTHPFALLALAGVSVQQASARPPTFAGGARWRWSAAPTWGLAIDGEALFQRRTDGPVTLWGMGGDLLALAEARVRFSGGSFRAGLGARGVVLRLTGSYAALPVPTTTASAWGAAVGPVARLAVAREGRRVVGELALAGGWCGPDVVFENGTRDSVGVGGWWVGASLAAGWTLGVD